MNIRDGSPFAVGLVLHLDERSAPDVDRYRARIWHNGRKLAEVGGPTPGKAVAELVASVRDLGLGAVEAEVTRELVRMMFGGGLGDFDA